MSLQKNDNSFWEGYFRVGSKFNSSNPSEYDLGAKMHDDIWGKSDQKNKASESSEPLNLEGFIVMTAGIGGFIIFIFVGINFGHLAGIIAAICFIGIIFYLAHYADSAGKSKNVPDKIKILTKKERNTELKVKGTLNKYSYDDPTKVSLHQTSSSSHKNG